MQLGRIVFPVSLRNRLISGGLEPVLGHTEKFCLASYYIQFSTIIRKNSFNLIIVHFYIRGNFIIRCDK